MKISTLPLLFLLGTSFIPELLCQRTPDLQFHLPKVPLGIPQGVLEVRIKGISSSSNWILGVRTDNSKPPFVVVGAGTLLPAEGVGQIRRLQDLAQVDSRKYQLKDGILSLDLSNAPSQGLLVYAIVAENTRLRCLLEGDVVTDTVAPSSLLVRNGQLTDEPFNGLNRLILRLQQPKLPPPPPIARMTNGVYLVSPRNAQDHLLTPGIRSMEASCDCPSSVLLVLDIDEGGAVTGVTSKGNDAALGGRAEKVARAWKFTPFTYQGQSVRVQAPVMLVADRAGELLLGRT